MQNTFDKYCAATTLRRAPTQGITFMINSGTRMQLINLEKLLIEHNVVCGIEHILAVPVHSCQKLPENMENHADVLNHDRHGLPSLQITNYPKYIPFVVAVEDYNKYIFNKGIGKTK